MFPIKVTLNLDVLFSLDSISVIFARQCRVLFSFAKTISPILKWTYVLHAVLFILRGIKIGSFCLAVFGCQYKIRQGNVNIRLLVFKLFYIPVQ